MSRDGGWETHSTSIGGRRAGRGGGHGGRRGQRGGWRGRARGERGIDVEASGGDIKMEREEAKTLNSEIPSKTYIKHSQARY